VTRVAKTRVNQFLGARENLTNVGVNVIGAVMNMIPYSRTDEYGRKYGYGYGYGYGRYRSYRSYRAYRSYGAYGNEAGYHPKASYAPKDFVAEIESDNKK